MSYARIQKTLLAAAMILGLAGCASTGEKEYTSAGKNNLHIRTTLDESGFMKSYVVFLYIYEVKDRCERNYLGFIKLTSDQSTLDYGLPVGKPLIVTAEFVVSSSGSQSRNSYEYLIQPGPAQEYFADIRLKANLYKFNLMESHAGGAKRLVERKGLGGCDLKG
jgi:hypothetical protein